jgi:CRISPR/Cas system CSM-associated protein Csm3 (group 7 of RAMP superfamily)
MQILIDLTVSFDGAFNIGAGAMGGSLAQRPLLADWRGLPIIPASSFKGRLRHTCKQLAEGLGHATCNDPRADEMCPGAIPGVQVCPVCRLFGSRQTPSPLTFSDLPLVEPAFLTQGTPPPTSLRYGVGLSRRRGVAADQLLYDTEVFMPGGTITCAGEISGHVDEADLGLLIMGLENLMTLGSGKTSGLGWCQVQYRLRQVDSAGKKQALDPAEFKRRWLA